MPSKIKTLPGVSHGPDLWMVEPDKIYVKPGFNPRQVIEVEDLKEYIKINGVRPLPPLRVCLRNGQIELITGHRRLKAVKELIEEGIQIKSLPCQLETTIAEDDLLAISIAENQGQPLTPLDQAYAYKRLIDFNWTVEEVARKIGKSQGHIYDRLKLTEAEIEIRDSIQDGSVTVTDAVSIIKEANKTGGDQKIIFKKRQATKVDKRTRAIQSLPVEERLWDILCPIVVKYGAELVYEVLETHAILQEVEE